MRKTTHWYGIRMKHRKITDENRRKMLRICFIRVPSGRSAAMRIVGSEGTVKMKEKTVTSAAKPKYFTAKNMAMIAIMTAVMCVLGPLSIPIGPVPISLTNFAIFLALYTVGTKRGTIAFIIYLILGCVGLPVFSSFTAGPVHIVGPTGGYLIGFIPMAIIAGLFIDRWANRRLVCIAGMVLSTAVVYFIGTVWLAVQAHMSAQAALAAGVLPFIAEDFIKIVLVSFIGLTIRRQLLKSGVLQKQA